MTAHDVSLILNLRWRLRDFHFLRILLKATRSASLQPSLRKALSVLYLGGHPRQQPVGLGPALLGLLLHFVPEDAKPDQSLSKRWVEVAGDLHRIDPAALHVQLIGCLIIDCDGCTKLPCTALGNVETISLLCFQKLRQVIFGHDEAWNLVFGLFVLAPDPGHLRDQRRVLKVSQQGLKLRCHLPAPPPLGLQGAPRQLELILWFRPQGS